MKILSTFNLSLWLAKNSFSGRRVDFYTDLAEALEDKAVLVEVITNLEQRAAQRRDAIEPIYALWLKRMDDRTFAKSLIGTVPDSDVMILEAAEQSNQLIDGLRFLAKAITAGNKMRSELITSIAGPIFLLVMFVALLVGFSYFLVPVLSEIMPPSSWPLIGRILYGVSQVITVFGMWIAGTFIVITGIYIYTLPRWTGNTRKWFDNYIPLYSIYRDFVGSIFLVALASLMRSGVGLAESLNTLALRASPWLSWHIVLIHSRLDKESGHPAKAFDTGVFNKDLTDRVMDFGSRSKFHEAIQKVGIASIDKITGYVSASAKLINRILIFVCGATMIFMVAGVLLTAQDAQNAIMRETFQVR